MVKYIYDCGWRANMPRTAHGQAIIGRVPEAVPFPGANSTRDGVGGVYLHFGHDLKITLGPNAGKGTTELILGQTSVDPRPFPNSDLGICILSENT